MPKAELEDFHVCRGVQPSESNINYKRVKKLALSIPEDRIADEEAAKSPFALPDELVAKVLGYLPLQDRFRLETVSRQWQRCMYLEVKDLYIILRHGEKHKYTWLVRDWNNGCELIISSQTKKLTAVLHKFRKSKVGHLNCDIDIMAEFSGRELFVLLADIASQATKVVVTYVIRSNPTYLITFCDIIGPRITTLELVFNQWDMSPEDIDSFTNSLFKMKRLKEVSSNWLDFILTCLNSLPTNSLPHFQEIDIGFSSECVWELWEEFKPLFGAQIKKIILPKRRWLDNKDEVLLPWGDMAPFANLEHLDFKFWLSDCTLTAVAEDLQAISRGCPLLTSIRVKNACTSDEELMVSLTEVRKLFVAIGEMKKLEKLDLELLFHFKDLGDISPGENLHLFALLENKCNITHLRADVTLYHIPSQNERIQCEVYGALNKAMPNLRQLTVGCIASELDHFVGFERMQIFFLYFHSNVECESVQNSLIRILKSSPALRSIRVSHWFEEIFEALIGTIIEVAELQMEKHIDFFAKIQVYDKRHKSWDARKHLAPRNLTLILPSMCSGVEVKIESISKTEGVI